MSVLIIITKIKDIKDHKICIKVIKEKGGNNNIVMTNN